MGDREDARSAPAGVPDAAPERCLRRPPWLWRPGYRPARPRDYDSPDSRTAVCPTPPLADGPSSRPSPGVQEDHAARAVRSALEIQEATRERIFGPGVSMQTRIGVNTGPAVCGTVGGAGRPGFTVHGDHVNLASRIEQARAQNPCCARSRDGRASHDLERVLQLATALQSRPPPAVAPGLSDAAASRARCARPRPRRTACSRARGLSRSACDGKPACCSCPCPRSAARRC